MYEIRNALENDRYGIGNVFCRSWQAAYKNILPQNYLSALTPENCTPNKISSNYIVIDDKEIILGVFVIAECSVKEVEYIYCG